MPHVLANVATRTTNHDNLLQHLSETKRLIRMRIAAKDIADPGISKSDSTVQVSKLEEESHRGATQRTRLVTRILLQPHWDTAELHEIG